MCGNFVEQFFVSKLNELDAAVQNSLSLNLCLDESFIFVSSCLSQTTALLKVSYNFYDFASDRIWERHINSCKFFSGDPLNVENYCFSDDNEIRLKDFSDKDSPQLLQANTEKLKVLLK